jgi:hypothetical protein
MKTLLITCICSVALAIGVFAQSPTVSPVASPPEASATPVASVATSPGASATAAGDLAAKIHKRIDKKLKQKGVHFTIGDDDDATSATKGDRNSDGGIPKDVIPLVGIVFLTIFGAPVLIVAVIMYFGFSKNRMMHRTVRLMVEKGQPVPEALLNPPPAVRKRSDMRRGVVLMMVGTGLMLFFAAVNDWEGGTWSLGVIPFLVGAGYLLVWKLEGKTDHLEPKRDNPPPLP